MEDMTRQKLDTPKTRRGFTLLELLIVVAVIALLVGLVFPAIRMVRKSAGLARELSTARQLMVAYRSYAYDARGVLMPGYYNLNGVTLPATDETGAELSGPGVLAASYVWRLAPYLDYNLNGLYVDESLLTHLKSNQQYDTYLISSFPALGLNGVFVGGDTATGAYDQDYETILGKFYVTRLSEVKHATRLIVFGSARINGPAASFAYPGAKVVEGYFRLKPPAFTERIWADQYEAECLAPCNTVDFGHVSLRHGFREAAIGFFDGHTGTLNESTIQDMRHWADQADRPDWVLEPIIP